MRRSPGCRRKRRSMPLRSGCWRMRSSEHRDSSWLPCRQRWRCSASTIGLLAPAGSAEFVTLTAAIAILAGALSIPAGVLRIGRLAQFFSESVLVVFIFGLALVIAVKQHPEGAGHRGRRRGVLRTLPGHHPAVAGDGPPDGRLWASTPSIGLMLPDRAAPARVPARSSSSSPASLLPWSSGSEDAAEVVGQIPAGLAPLRLPAWASEPVFIPGSPGAMYRARNLREAIGLARGFASRHKYDIDANKETVALGAANVGAGLFRALRRIEPVEVGGE